MLRTTEEFMKELQYTEVLSKEPLIRLEGQKILIHGGAGVIGPISIQLAKYLAKSELGADKVIDYMKENFEDMIHDYDATF